MATGWESDDDTPSPLFQNPFAPSEDGGDDDDSIPEVPYQEEEVPYLQFTSPVAQPPTEQIVAASIDDYPAIKRLHDYAVLASQSTISYRPPEDTAMTPAAYPPAPALPSTSQTPRFEGYTAARRPPGGFKREEANEWWQFPSAQNHQGALFIIPTDLGMFNDAFLRWESITKNYLSMINFSSAQEKANFIENLLGEKEKLTWVAWRMAYQDEYNQMINNSDGDEGTQNILSQIRRVFTLEDPVTGSTVIQEQAYRDLERLTCPDIKSIIPFLRDYLRLAAQSGRMFISPELSDKLWFKLPGDLGKEIGQRYSERYPGSLIGVAPRIFFTYNYLKEKCKEAAFQRSLKS